MPGPNEIFANYAALEALTARLSALSTSFSSIAPLEEIPVRSAGDASLARAYEDFRSQWHGNRHSILDELESASAVVREAAATYRAADSGVAGGAHS